MDEPRLKNVLALPRAPFAAEELHVLSTVDELMYAARTFRHTHLKKDLMRILKLAQELQSFGYKLVWIRNGQVVGAHRLDLPGYVYLPDPNSTKEVIKRAIKQDGSVTIDDNRPRGL